MKILTVVMDLDFGGTQRTAQIFAESYHELGHESKVLTLYGLGSRINEINPEVEVLDGMKDIDKIEGWEPGIIHFHSTGLREEDVRLIVEKNQSSHCRFIETNVFSRPTPWADLMDESFQLSTWADWIFKLKGGAEFKSRIVPNPIRIESFSPATAEAIKEFRETLQIPEDGIVIGRIGQAFPGKWSPMLIEVFNNLAQYNSNIYLLLVNAPNGILSFADKSTYKDRIRHIHKIIGDDKLRIAYSSMKLMLHIAEQGESFGIVLCECILCGTPVVTLSTPWNDNSQCEVVGHKRGGLVANTKKGIISAVKLIIEDKINILISQRASEIKKSFNYLEIAKNALGDNNSQNSTKSRTEILKIYKDSFDKPNFLTTWLLSTNMDFFRRMTIYSSGHKSLKNLLVRRLFARNKIEKI
ncbi:glycosyltransferase [Muricauda sp. JGD-17]|uniref:Glycosyltransferase n=1 Tax=Flagellimonas ochracea TaxID=2696472 RepID=A0A964TAF7_9FLAO|nr:glycosyltransferase [Allomuricauda ochracea]NAY91235.1 glycosyltransferase [Allomuricauda ochracea]